MYNGRIIRVTNLRRHNNADRLQCTEICGYNIIVAIPAKSGSTPLENISFLSTYPGLSSLMKSTERIKTFESFAKKAVQLSAMQRKTVRPFT